MCSPMASASQGVDVIRLGPARPTCAPFVAGRVDGVSAMLTVDPPVDAPPRAARLVGPGRCVLSNGCASVPRHAVLHLTGHDVKGFERRRGQASHEL